MVKEIEVERKRGKFFRFFPRFKSEIILFCISIIIYGSIFYEVAYDNENSRIDLILAMLFEKSFIIDNWHENTMDKAYFNGHFYSDKAIGLSFLGLPVGMLLRAIFPDFIHSDFGILVLRYILRMLIISIPCGILSMILFRFIYKITTEKELSFAITIFYILGSSAFPYSCMFYGHQFAAFCSFLSIWLLLNAFSKKISPNISLFAAGFLCGISFISEYPSIIIGGVLLIFIFLWETSRKLSPLFLLGLLIPASFLGLYNHSCFGDPFVMSYAHKYTSEFQAIHSQGVFGISYPNLKALITLLFSPAKGLFFMSPWLLFSFWGLYKGIKEPSSKPIALLLGAIFFVYLFFAASFVDYQAGWTFGPRHLIPAIPFLVALLSFVPWRIHPYLPYAFIGVGIVSILFFAIGTCTSAHIPLVFSSPLLEFFIPLLKYGYLSLTLSSLFNFNLFIALTLYIASLLVAIFLLVRDRETGFSLLTLFSFVIIGSLFLIINLQMLSKDYGNKAMAIGDVLRFNKMYQKAEIEYRKAISFEARKGEYYARLGKCLEEKGDVMGAIQAYHTALKYNGHDLHSLGSFGILLNRKGAFDTAKKTLQKAVELMPWNAEYRYHLGIAYRNLGEEEMAQNEFRKIIKMYEQGKLKKESYPFVKMALNALTFDLPAESSPDEGINME